MIIGFKLNIAYFKLLKAEFLLFDFKN